MKYGIVILTASRAETAEYALILPQTTRFGGLFKTKFLAESYIICFGVKQINI